MNKLLLAGFLMVYALIANAQQEKFTYNVINLNTPLSARFTFSEVEELPAAKIIHLQAEPKPLNPQQTIKAKLTAKHLMQNKHLNIVEPTQLNKNNATPPEVLRSFAANISQGTPNDNDVAVSNNNIVASCVNTNINFYNDTGRFIWGRLLSALTNKLGQLNRTYDPRVIYDPIEDKFILVFLQGTSSADTRIIVGFSTDTDPSKPWNFYQIPGNVTGDSSWSDYPIISISKSDLFITVNRLKDNTFWKDGFIESYIWQVNKANGFAGDTLRQRVYNNIRFNNNPIWSVCPTRYSNAFDKDEMFFLSVRPDQPENDTLFLHRIDQSLSSGNATLTTRVLKTPVKYGLQPNALMPSGQLLQTNDARVLSAMVVNGVIYFTGNTIDFTKTAPAIYFGTIENTWTNNPLVKMQIISYDSMDIGYPSIAYCGSGLAGDHRSMITFSHSSRRHFPGTSVVYVDRNFNVSPPVFVRQGLNSINVLADTIERWGDYTGIQTKYNEKGICWLSGNFGDASGSNRTVVARVKATDLTLGSKQIVKEVHSVLYPNPVVNYATVEFSVNSRMTITVEVGSIDGKYLKDILVDIAKPGLNQLRIATESLPNGTYFVNLKSNEGIIKTHKFVVVH